MSEETDTWQTDVTAVCRGEGAEELIANAMDGESADRNVETFNAYAPPMIYGPAVRVASHIGSVTYTITYSAIGNTLVEGQVTYYEGSGGGKKVTKTFYDSVTITTSNSVANVECAFKGIPLGSAVEGTVR